MDNCPWISFWNNTCINNHHHHHHHHSQQQQPQHPPGIPGRRRHQCRLGGTCCNGCTTTIPSCPTTRTMTTTTRTSRRRHHRAQRRQQRPPRGLYNQRILSNPNETRDHRKSSPNGTTHDLAARTTTRTKLVSKPVQGAARTTTTRTEPARNRRPPTLVRLAAPVPRRQQQEQNERPHPSNNDDNTCWVNWPMGIWTRFESPWPSRTKNCPFPWLSNRSGFTLSSNCRNHKNMSRQRPVTRYSTNWCNVWWPCFVPAMTMTTR